MTDESSLENDTYVFVSNMISPDTMGISPDTMEIMLKDDFS